MMSTKVQRSNFSRRVSMAVAINQLFGEHEPASVK
jgi:hypothetical protein